MLRSTLRSNRVVTYAYDGLQRLTAATESPGASYAYDAAGNSSGGTRTVTQTFNAANQIDGLTYDLAGNLTDDGSSTYTYDALNRMTLRSTTPYTYNGDGALVDDGATRYTQDLASPLSQVLQTSQGSSTNYLYGLDRLAAVAGITRTWYVGDALGSVRMTLDDAGAPLGVVSYDPWGTVESGTVPTFGFTGEVQSGGMVNLRARWYSAGQGRFVSRDPFVGTPKHPYSQHPYAYAFSNPMRYLDPTGRCSTSGDDYCYSINTWEDFAAAYPYDYPRPVAQTPGAQRWGVRGAVIFAQAYERFWSNPVANLADISPANVTLRNATVFAEYFLEHGLLADERADYTFLILSKVEEQRSLTDVEQCAFFALAGAFGARQYEPDRGSDGGRGAMFARRLDNGAEILAELDKNGVLWTAVDVPETFKGQGIGKRLFGEAWDAYKEQATAIGGEWGTKMPDNLNSFNANLNAKMSLEDAALNTFTGKQAAARGFTEVEFVRLTGTSGAYTNVEVIFR